jgi:hypothetical protein
MTRTEERLRDALHASARRVHDDRLRPLPTPPPKTTERWRAWLVPLAAAASVVLIIGLVLAVTKGPRPAPQPSSNSSTPLPRYFARFVQTSKTSGIQVQSVSTGAVTAYLPSPKSPQGGALNIDGLAAAPDDRTFYVEYGLVSPDINVTQVRILTFSLSSDGSATPMTMVKGGLLSHQPPGLQTWGNLAVSPDGSRLALTVDSSDHITNASPAYSDKIIVIDLRTGQRTAWQGGLDRPGQTFSIPDLSWSADGRSLVFLGQWCTAMVAPACDGTPGSSGYRDAQVWSLTTATSGGLLSRGHLLLRESTRYPLIAQALAGPQAENLTLAILSGQPNKFGQHPDLTVEDASQNVEYHLAGHGESPQQVWLTADPSGQHLLLSYAVDGGFMIGWIANGAFHPLPITQPYLPNNATLVIAW